MNPPIPMGKNSIPAAEFWPGEQIIRANAGGEAPAALGCRNGADYLFAVDFKRSDPVLPSSSRPEGPDPVPIVGPSAEAFLPCTGDGEK